MTHENQSNVEDFPVAYDALKHEARMYEVWDRSGFFNPDTLPNNRREPFCILMPPPNVTGVLHLGHVLEQAIMDTRIRFERMRGKRAVLVPGTDHAAVATQARVEKDLVELGIQNPRSELGREELLRRIREYADDCKKTIVVQMKKLGASCDWSRYAYTLDEIRSEAVVETFAKMYAEGLIYRGYRIVNWDPKGQTTISDDEIVYREAKTTFYYFKYGPFTIGTARPETKFGDKYVVVHPKDSRYERYQHGEKIDLEWINGPVSATVIKDDSIDMSFGTGAMTITPWHSTADFDIAVRHGLDKEQIIDTHGRLLPIAGEFSGMHIDQVREKIVKKLQSKGLLVKEEPYAHMVATADRSEGVIEPQILEQWFVAVNKKIPSCGGKSLKDLMREAGDVIEIKPDRFRKVYYQWIDNLRDWCISRQIWWGHRIPVWYRKGNGIKETESLSRESGTDIFVGASPPDADGWTQDPDTLDTWFSSGLWSFSTLGWPRAMEGGVKRADLAAFHPISWMQMGYEIIFFWMARMILMSEYVLHEIPFRSVYIHGLVRDKDGRKFSKSLRNALNPLDIIAHYGTDALRLSMLVGVAPGSDINFDVKKIEHYQHFVNKLWNIARFIISGSERVNPDKHPQSRTLADRWVLSRLSTVRDAVTGKIEKADFSLAATTLYDFTWSDFADWYLEIAKVEGAASEEAKLAKHQLLLFLLHHLLRLWHPFIPYVTEVLWERLRQPGLLLVATWPTALPTYDKSAEEEFTALQESIRAIRDQRSRQKVPLHQKVRVHMLLTDESQRVVIERLARCEIVSVDSRSLVIESIDALTPGKRKELEAYVASLEAKLARAEFIQKAPAQIVAEEREKLREAKEKLG